MRDAKFWRLIGLDKSLLTFSLFLIPQHSTFVHMLQKQLEYNNSGTAAVYVGLRAYL